VEGESATKGGSLSQAQVVDRAKRRRKSALNCFSDSQFSLYKSSKSCTADIRTAFCFVALFTLLWVEDTRVAAAHRARQLAGRDLHTHSQAVHTASGLGSAFPLGCRPRSLESALVSLPLGNYSIAVFFMYLLPPQSYIELVVYATVKVEPHAPAPLCLLNRDTILL